MANEKRLIEANALKGDFMFLRKMWSGTEIMELIDSATTVDAVEVVHGRWEFGELEIMGQPVHCSICGWGADMVNKAMWLEYPGHKCCGNCGAKMDGERREGE